MDKSDFCNRYCPIPTKYVNVDDPEDQFVDCELDELNCPFNKVDFKVAELRGN